MEHVDPLTGATPAWDAFVRSLDPEQIEQARYRKPGPGERPGSHDWNVMVIDHTVLREAFYRTRPRPISDDDLAEVINEASAWERRQEGRRSRRRFLPILSNTNPREGN